jgi:hypothetical protein
MNEKNLTDCQLRIIDDLIGDFTLRNATMENNTNFSFFDDFLNQSKIDKQTILDLTKKREIIIQESLRAVQHDAEKLKPYIEKCGLKLKVDNNFINIGEKFPNNDDDISLRNSISLEYYLKDKIIILPSGLKITNCEGFGIKYLKPDARFIRTETIEEMINAS